MQKKMTWDLINLKLSWVISHAILDFGLTPRTGPLSWEFWMRGFSIGSQLDFIHFFCNAIAIAETSMER
jgi:hypothetical protein